MLNVIIIMFEFDESTVINGCLICFSLILRVSFERDWLRKDLNVIGWLAPSSIPAIGGKSLSGLFFFFIV